MISIKKVWQRITGKKNTPQEMTRKEQILFELSRGKGTARQLSDRMGVSLSIVRTNLTGLKKKGLIKDSGQDKNINPAFAGEETVWEAVKAQ